MRLVTWLSLVSIITSKLVTVYWGQGLGGSENNLKDYCNDKSIDIIIITYLSQFDGRTKPLLGLKTECTEQWCTDVGGDIRFCQSKGKKVLLSLGGSAVGRYILSSSDFAESFAQQIFSMFFDRSSDKLPLGDVSLDGIDLSIQNLQGMFYSDFTLSLRKLSQSFGKKILITASPGCKIPDPSMDDVVRNGQLDYFLVKFYNDPECESDSNMNIKEWDELAQSVNAKVFLGVAGARRLAKSGYLPLESVKRRVTALSKSIRSFGGVAINDAGGSFGDDGYGTDLANFLHSNSVVHLPSYLILVSVLFYTIVL